MTAEPIEFPAENIPPEMDVIASESPDLTVLPDLEALGIPMINSEEQMTPGRELDRLLTGESAELANDLWDEQELEIPYEKTVKKEELRSLSVLTNQDEFPTYPGNSDSQKQILESEILALQTQKSQLLQDQLNFLQAEIERVVKENISGLEQRKQALELDIERLERRQAKIQQEMRTTFAGVSQELAIRVQGFKDYLVGSLQDLVAAADQLELANSDPWNVADLKPEASKIDTVSNASTASSLGFAEQKFVEQRRQIQRLLEQYRTRPDYYGPPWQLRRTFEPIHAERVQDWFFTQGGRGVIRTMGSRLQNILVAGSVISILANLYGDRSRALILANSPERLGEWRRGLQDCLGISRTDFGPERGVVLFESPEALIQKAERLVEERLQPLVLIDDTQEQIDLALLQFPLWLAFAPDPQEPSSNYFY